VSSAASASRTRFATSSRLLLNCSRRDRYTLTDGGNGRKEMMEGWEGGREGEREGGRKGGREGRGWGPHLDSLLEQLVEDSAGAAGALSAWAAGPIRLRHELRLEGTLLSLPLPRIAAPHQRRQLESGAIMDVRGKVVDTTRSRRVRRGWGENTGNRREKEGVGRQRDGGAHVKAQRDEEGRGGEGRESRREGG
jgi:hypothetical protein